MATDTKPRTRKQPKPGPTQVRYPGRFALFIDGGGIDGVASAGPKGLAAAAEAMKLYELLKFDIALFDCGIKRRIAQAARSTSPGASAPVAGDT